MLSSFLQSRSDDADSPPPLEGGGSGRSLPLPLLATAAGCSVFATLLSLYSIVRQLRAYYKPTLQRYTVRILVMVPIYSIASFTSLFSLRSAFVVDVLRDLYEAVTLLSLFNLLIEYLGGERSILVLAHGRKPVSHPWPVKHFYPPLDMSNPHTFLALKRGVLQYVQIKPVLAIGTIATKLTGTYHDGKLGLNYYTLEQFIYNFSVFLSLYCLAMFWSCLSQDLASFRVTSKFICIKGIIFFSFWQGLAVSIVVSLGWIKQIGPVADPQYLSIAITDVLICLEMPFFAIAHLYAFSPRDYIEPSSYYQARLPPKYAVRDALGVYDMMSDAVDTIRGGMRHRYSAYSGATDAPGSGTVMVEGKVGGHGHHRQHLRKETWLSRTTGFVSAPIAIVRAWSRRRRGREDNEPLLNDENDEHNARGKGSNLEHGQNGKREGAYHYDSGSSGSDDGSDDDELAVKLRGLAKDGVVGLLDFLTGQRFAHSHEGDNESVVSCHFSLHEDGEPADEQTPSSSDAARPLDDTEPFYVDARNLAREDDYFPGARTGRQEEQLRQWIVDQEAALSASAADDEERRRRRGRGKGKVAQAAAAAADALPWAKRRRQREEELIGRMRTIREKKMARREERRKRGDQRRAPDAQGGSADATSASGSGSASVARKQRGDLTEQSTSDAGNVSSAPKTEDTIDADSPSIRNGGEAKANSDQISKKEQRKQSREDARQERKEARAEDKAAKTSRKGKERKGSSA